MQDAGLFVDVDNGENTLPKKIRNGEIAQYNFILGERSSLCPSSTTLTAPAVVGQEELDSQSVNVRNREDVGSKARSEMIKLDEVVEKMVALKKERRLENKL